MRRADRRPARLRSRPRYEDSPDVVDEDLVGTAGGQLAETGLDAEAVALTRNSQCVARSPTVHAWLAEARMRTGDYEGAILAFQRGPEPGAGRG